MAEQFALMIGISPYAHEPEHDEDGLEREDTHEAFEQDDGTELHLPKFTSRAAIAKHVACLEHELTYYRAVLSGDERAASKARQQLHSALGGDSDE